MPLDPIVQQVIAFSVIASLFLVMQFRRQTPTDVLFLGALILLVLCGLISPEEAWLGFSNRAVVAIAGLLVISSALRNAGVLDVLGRWLLSRVRSESAAQLRVSTFLVTTSAFLLNTALVAMMMPVVLSWCRSSRVAASRMLLPVSYATILGGICTLVGTSTTLLVDGELAKASKRIEALEQSQAVGRELSVSDSWLVQHADQLQPMGLLEISWVGVPCALIGIVFLVLIGRHLMPRRSEVLTTSDEVRREYLIEMLVQANCPLVGKTVEEGGLRGLHGLFLIEIDRDGESITPVEPSDRLMANDRLVFTGVVSTIVELEKIPGLIPVSEEQASDRRGNKSIVEVVLSPSSPLIGKTIRQANFRQLYNAAVMAVHRNGRRIPRKIGDIELEPGDTLLLQARPSFLATYRHSRAFYLVSSVDDAEARRHDKFPIAAGFAVLLLAWLLAIPLLAAVGAPSILSDPPLIILTVALAMIVTRCLPAAQARDSVDWSLIITIGSAIGIGAAVDNCGAADSIANSLVGAVGDNPWVLLATIYLMTVVFTELLSNAAVAAMMFQVAVDVAQNADASPRPFVMAVVVAASLSFISPIGYQTNLMVMGPGNYKPTDYMKAGIPLSLLVGMTAIFLIPYVWNF